MFSKAYPFLMLLVSTTFFGQNSRFEVNANTGFLYYSADGTKSASNVEGSQYIDQMFYPSRVSGVNAVTPPMRYNAFKDEIEFVDGGKTYYATKSEGLEIKMTNKTYIFLEHPTEKGDRGGYLAALLNDKDAKFSVYKKERVILIPEYDSGSSYRSVTPAHYKADEEKFYLGTAGKIVFMPKKEKEVIALLPSHEQEIKKFMKENKISLKKDADMVKLFSYLNTLG